MTKRVNNRTASVAIAAREAFRNSTGSFHGQPVDRAGFLPTGILPFAWQGELDNTEGRVTYIVYSYATPIAWALDDGTVVIPDVKYSRTTSNHQARAHIGLADEDVAIVTSLQEVA